MKKYNIISEFNGYVNKRDKTKLVPGVLISGSKNVVSTDGDTVASRPGFTIDGDSNASLAPIRSSYDWVSHLQFERNLRAYDDGTKTLEYRYVASDNTVTWRDIGFTPSSEYMNFDDFWDNTEKKSAIVFVDGTDDLHFWYGGVTTFASATATTLTKEGSTSWAEEGFLLEDYTLGDSTSQFDITNPAGTTFRYTFDGTGADPAITSSLLRVGMVMYINAQNFNSANNGVFTITGSGANYFEVTNASGVVESNKTIGTGFIDYNAKQIIIDGTTYTYRGGESTTTLTNVTPDPTSGGYSAGEVVHQAVRTVPLKPASGVKNDLVIVFKNQIYVGSTTSRVVYISKQNDYNTWTQSAPRLPGEAAIITLDKTPVGFGIQEDFVYISAGKEKWYQIGFQLSADLTNESVTIQELKTDKQGGAISQGLIGNMKNSIIFVSNEPTVDKLGRVENVTTPQSKPTSDPIKTDMDGYTFTNGHITYYKNNIYIALPTESIVLIYNIEKQFWEAPWVMPAGRLAIISGELYLHSNAVPETYKLFSGYSDNGNPINAVARFSYMGYNKRAVLKSHNEWFSEGYISESTELTRKLYFDINGYTGTDTKTITGDSSQPIIFKQELSGSLGKYALGKVPLGGSSTAQTSIPKFRVVHTNSKVAYYEIAVEYSSNDTDQQWEILSFGSDVSMSSNNNLRIKQ